MEVADHTTRKTTKRRVLWIVAITLFSFFFFCMLPGFLLEIIERARTQEVNGWKLTRPVLKGYTEASTTTINFRLRSHERAEVFEGRRFFVHRDDISFRQELLPPIERSSVALESYVENLHKSLLTIYQREELDLYFRDANLNFERYAMGLRDAKDETGIYNTRVDIVATDKVVITIVSTGKSAFFDAKLRLNSLQTVWKGSKVL